MPKPVLNLAIEKNAKELLARVDTMFIDLDGVCYLNKTAIEGAAETIEALRKAGKRIIYATNNGRVTRRQIVDKLTHLGFRISLDEVMCTTYAAAVYLKEKKFDGKVYLMAESGMAEELKAVGIRTIGLGSDPESAVALDYKLDPEVLCCILSFDSDINFTKLIKFASYLNRLPAGTDFYLATNPDRRMPVAKKDIVVPDTGCTTAYLEVATGKLPILIGKPEKFFFECIKKGLGLKIDPSRVAMFGDQFISDIAFGNNNGFGASVLVETGLDKLVDLKAQDPSKTNLVPTHYMSKLSDLLPFL